LKAIHNGYGIILSQEDPVFRAKNYKFESNSQQAFEKYRFSCPVFRAKNYEFESNSQLSIKNLLKP